jgi:hypothetical protein
MANSAASKLLQNQLKSRKFCSLGKGLGLLLYLLLSSEIITEPVEGFTAELKNEANMFEWKIFVEGPKDSP